VLARALIQFVSMRSNVCLPALVLMAVFTARAADQKGVEFARPGGKPLLLDLHVPNGSGPFAAAILVHGGGFDEGSRSTNVRPLFDVLSNAGFAWFTIDYRLAPAAHLPEANADVLSAIKWVKAHAAEYHVDASKIALIGESAGGFLVNYAGTHGASQSQIAAVVDFYGPADYAKLALLRREHPEGLNMTSINRHAANGGGIPFFGAEPLKLFARSARGVSWLPLRAAAMGWVPGERPKCSIGNRK
jgi:acetyl esterase/lipase